MEPISQNTDDLKLTSKDFAECGWKTFLSECKGDSYSTISQAFFDASNKADLEGRKGHGKALWLIAQACSMMLTPSDRNAPFKPAFIFEGKRSGIPEDFVQFGLSHFENILSDIESPRMKARVADLLWIVRTPRDRKFAIEAIDAYKLVPLTGESWPADALDCWSRATSLARALGTGAGSRLSELETDVLNLIESATSGDLFFASKLADLLKTNSLGHDQALQVAEKLETLANELQQVGNHYAGRAYFKDASLWFMEAGEEEKSIEMLVQQAETWVLEAKARLSSDDPSNLVAADFYQDAIQVYRTIPRKHREKHQVDQRMQEIRQLLEEASKHSTREMSSIEGPAIDLSEFLETTRKLVTNKPTIEALGAFANSHRIDAAKLLESAREGLSRSPLRALVSMTMMTHDGRVGARTYGMSGQTPSDRNEETVEAEAIHLHYETNVRLAAEIILYGLQILAQEHRMTEHDFVRLARYSTAVPPEREMLFGKGLYLGFNGDFATAIHLLAPQIEHAVRFQLKLRDVTTTALNGEGIETENGLSALIDIPQVKEIFGDDTTFEIKALFCSPYGANLRNNVAHGLLNDSECYSTHSVYAWWFALKLAVNSLRSPQAPEREMSE